MLSYISLVIACVSLLVTGLILRSLKKFKPMISRAYSIMGKKGNEIKVDQAMLDEVEEGLKGGVLEMLETKHPELGIMFAWMEENKPDLFQKIVDNPQIALGLYKKYAPMIAGLIGGKMNPQKKAMYDI